jgi:repressor LexA
MNIEEVVCFIFTFEGLENRRKMKTPYTPRQGQYLAFLHHYATLHDCPPAEADLARFFQVTPPTVHLMILTLERRRLITRMPGQARSIRVILPPESLPSLQGVASVSTNTHAQMRQAEGQEPAGSESAMLRLGKIQIEELFAHNNRKPLDDSEFIPLLDTLIQSFVRAGLGVLTIRELRRHVCQVYHCYCLEADPSSTIESDKTLMLSYLPASSRTLWLQQL